MLNEPTEVIILFLSFMNNYSQNGRSIRYMKLIFYNLKVACNTKHIWYLHMLMWQHCFQLSVFITCSFRFICSERYSSFGKYNHLRLFLYWASHILQALHHCDGRAERLSWPGTNLHWSLSLIFLIFWTRFFKNWAQFSFRFNHNKPIKESPLKQSLKS